MKLGLPEALCAFVVVGLVAGGAWREKLAIQADLAIREDHALKGCALVPTLHGAYGEPVRFTGVLRAKDGTDYTLFESTCATVVVFREADGSTRTLVLEPIAPVQSGG